MQHSKVFFKIAWKMLPALSIYFIIYSLLTIFLTVNGQENIDSNFQATELNICVIDEDDSLASKALNHYLGSIHHLVPLEHNPEVLQDHLYYRDIVYVLSIPAGFEEKLLNGERQNLLTNVKLPGSSSGVFIDQQISSYLDSIRLYLCGGYPLADAISLTAADLSCEDTVDTLIFNKDNTVDRKDIFYFYQYIPYMLIVLLICSIAPILTTFRKADLAKRITASASSYRSHTLQLTFSSMLLALFLWLCFVLLGIIQYRENAFTANTVYAILNSFVFLLVATAIAFCVSNFTLNRNVADMIANVLGLGMSFLCGVFVPQSMLPESTLNAAKFLPAYWYIRVNNMLGGFSNETFDLRFYWTALGIQLLFAIALFTITVVLRKKTLQRT